MDTAQIATPRQFPKDETGVMYQLSFHGFDPLPTRTISLEHIVSQNWQLSRIASVLIFKLLSS
jgi:hypothetical protein